jgi:hypothetical protein
MRGAWIVCVCVYVCVYVCVIGPPLLAGFLCVCVGVASECDRLHLTILAYS